MSANNSSSNLPNNLFGKPAPEVNFSVNSKSVLNTNGSDIQKIVQDGTPAEEIIKFIEERELSDMAISCILEKILNSHRPSIQKYDIINITLGKIEKSKVSNFLTEKKSKDTGSGKKGQDQAHGKGKICYFFQVVLKGDLELLDLILKQDLQINYHDNSNRNALFYAINAEKGDNVDIVLRLITAGVNVNEVEIDEEHSPLTLASKKNLRNTVKALLESKANPNHRDKFGNTALHFAVFNKSTEMVKTILNYYPDLTVKNKDNLNQIELASKLNLNEIYHILAEEYNIREEKAKTFSKEFMEDCKQNKKQDHIFNNLNVNNYNFMERTNSPENESDRDSVNDKNLSSNIASNKDFSEPQIIMDNQFSQFSNNSNNSFHMNNNQINKQAFMDQGNNFPMKNPQMFIPNQHMMQMNPNPGSNFFNYSQHPSMMNFQGGNQTPQSFSNKSKNFSNNNLNMNTNFSQPPNSGFNKKQQRNQPTHQNVTLYTKENNQIGYRTIPQFKNIYVNVPFHFNESRKKEGFPQRSSSTMSDQLSTALTPSLTIDLSDENKILQFVNASKNEDLHRMSIDLSKANSKLELDFKLSKEENMKLIEELNNRDGKIANLNNELKIKDERNFKMQKDLQLLMEDKNKIISQLVEKNEKLERELAELKSRETSKLSKIGNAEFNQEKDFPRMQYLDKKFSLIKYDDKYSGKCLQKDLLDFQELTKDQIKKMKFLQDELVKCVQDAVSEITPDLEVKVFGSHATNLCLPWSDLDLVIVQKSTYPGSFNAFLQSLYFNLFDKKWKKTAKYIDSAAIPIIKMTSADQFNNMQIDISMQDQKHFGIRCVELVKSFLKEYEVLEPLILALKNILKYANLNDPYTVSKYLIKGGLSSYGLILMVVSFLQSQLENKKSIKISDLGMIFLEFLWYYGYVFDHSKYVIYAYPPNDSSSLDKEAINNFFLNIQSAHELIIVDPLSKTNNVAKSTYQYVNIKMAFMIAFVVAHEDCECGCHYNKLVDDANFAEHCILKRIFLAVKRFNSSSGNA